MIIEKSDSVIQFPPETKNVYYKKIIIESLTNNKMIKIITPNRLILVTIVW